MVSGCGSMVLGQNSWVKGAPADCSRPRGVLLATPPLLPVHCAHIKVNACLHLCPPPPWPSSMNPLWQAGSVLDLVAGSASASLPACFLHSWKELRVHTSDSKCTP
ncbi:hypothetical protein BS78_08G074400 [Paspalum vaginatum]|nr:hypothetical protein BS78_08G074400 [Paspalum vaginatum]